MVDQFQDLVIKHLQDAYAMEENVLKMLDSLIANTSDGFMLSLLQDHRAETVEHARRVQARLQQLGQTSSMTKTAAAMASSLFKSAIDTMRDEKASKNLRDAFVTEHLEIAGYELLERYAKRANDFETAAVAQRNKADEEAMAQRLSELWDRAVDQDLGVPATVA